MKNILIILLITAFGVIPEFSAPEVQAQQRTEVQQKRKAVRGVRLRTRRRTKRRIRRRVNRRAHIRYAKLPRYRARVSVLPGGAVRVVHTGVTYHYHGGVYYKPAGNGFVVVRPAYGLRIRTLPVGHRVMVVNKRNYYYYYGSFYEKQGEEFAVIEAPEGALVDALPDGYEVVEVDGQEYYKLDNDYYQEVETDELEDGVGYEVVKVE